MDLSAIRRLSGIHDSMAKAAGIKQARVRCSTCGREESVDGAACLKRGWPTCCKGHTMTLLTGGGE